MAPATASLLGSATCSRVWLLVLLIAQPAISARLGTSDWIADSGPNDLELEGVAHKTLKMFDSWSDSDEKLMASIPGDLFAILKKNELIQEYKSLASQVGMSGRGRFGNWKGSEVHRTMYIGGHEDAFHAKGVSIYLCKGASSGMGLRSPLKLYFVDRAIQPTYMPPDTYSDAKSVVKKTAINDEVESKEMPEGVLASSFDDEQILSDKQSMPVDILKLFEAKDALQIYMNFAAEVKVKGHTWFQAYVTTYEYQEQFRAKGLGVFFCLTPFDRMRNVVRHTWLEYVDLAVAPSYVPQEVYRTDIAPTYQMCMKGNASAWYSLMAEDAFNAVGRSKNGISCGSTVIGATGRENGDSEELLSCKCPDNDQALFCGSQQIDDRKFSMSKMRSHCGAFSRDVCAYNRHKRDSNLNGCSWYKNRDHLCGRYDSATFQAEKYCCACGGGTRTKKATKENVAYCARKACLPAGA